MKKLILYSSVFMMVLLVALWVCLAVLMQDGHDLILYPVVLVSMMVIAAIALGFRVYMDREN